MNPTPSPHFEEIKEKIIERQKMLERQGESLNREAIRSVIEEEIEKGLKNLPPVSPTEIAPPASAIKVSQETDELKAAEKKIEELVTIAFESGIVKAVDLARKTSQAYLIDRLHDVLVDRFYEALVKEGKIKILK